MQVDIIKAQVCITKLLSLSRALYVHRTSAALAAPTCLPFLDHIGQPSRQDKMLAVYVSANHW